MYWEDRGKAEVDTASAVEEFHSNGGADITQSHVIENKCLESV